MQRINNRFRELYYTGGELAFQNIIRKMVYTSVDQLQEDPDQCYLYEYNNQQPNLSSVHASLAEIEEDVKFAEAVNG